MGTHGLCPLFLDTTHVDTTHGLGFGGTKVLHVIRKSISSLLFFKSISPISLRLTVSLISLCFSKSKQTFSRDLIFSFFSSSLSISRALFRFLELSFSRILSGNRTKYRNTNTRTDKGKSRYIPC